MARFSQVFRCLAQSIWCAIWSAIGDWLLDALSANIHGDSGPMLSNRLSSVLIKKRHNGRNSTFPLQPEFSCPNQNDSLAFGRSTRYRLRKSAII
jgi:hypothetical protein